MSNLTEEQRRKQWYNRWGIRKEQLIQKAKEKRRGGFGKKHFIYYCVICGKDYLYSTSLREHLKVTHGIKKNYSTYFGRKSLGGVVNV